MPTAAMNHCVTERHWTGEERGRRKLGDRKGGMKRVGEWRIEEGKRWRKMQEGNKEARREN